jgi:3-hydroxypropanoate dehydrogenase
MPMNNDRQAQALDDAALDQLFREARTYAVGPNPWHDRPVADELLHRLWDLVKMGPTSANTEPARIVFVKSAEAKAKLEPCARRGQQVEDALGPGDGDRRLRPALLRETRPAVPA